MPVGLARYVGWAALLSVAATLATVVTGFLFFVRDKRFGLWSDAASAVQMAAMLPLPVGFYAATTLDRSALAAGVAAAGIGGMLIAGSLQFLIVLRVASFERTIPSVLAAGGAIGVWLVLANYLALAQGLLSAPLASAGTVAGAGYILVSIAFYVGDEHHPLTHMGGLAACVGYGIWAFGVARLALAAQ